MIVLVDSDGSDGISNMIDSNGNDDASLIYYFYFYLFCFYCF